MVAFNLPVSKLFTFWHFEVVRRDAVFFSMRAFVDL